MKKFLISARHITKKNKAWVDDYRKMYRVSTIKIIAIISSSDIYYFIEI